MFDTVVVQTRRTEYVPYEKVVHEHRAPTDDSIKLFKEMQEKAYDSILATLELKDNPIKYRGIIYRDHMNLKIWFAYEFTLNGKEYSDKIDIHEPFHEVDPQSLARLIYEHASKAIAAELVGKAMTEAMSAGNYTFRR